MTHPGGKRVQLQSRLQEMTLFRYFDLKNECKTEKPTVAIESHFKSCQEKEVTLSVGVIRYSVVPLDNGKK